jgi:hypothetical protein
MDIDHADGDPSNNAFRNLRVATRSENLANSRKRLDNTSGFKGVCWDRRRRLWQAKVSVSGRTITIGHFSSAEAAHTAYARALINLHHDFARIS